ncbi:MAG: discoidin domain-containing protein, partial [Actinobacteria bacterium]
AAVSARGAGTAASAVDGDTRTSFSAASIGDHVTLDLGGQRNISGVGVAFSGPVRSFGYADVRVSTNGKRWLPVRSVQGQALRKSVTVYPFETPVRARYVRIVPAGSSDPAAPTRGLVRELEVYGR